MKLENESYWRKTVSAESKATSHTVIVLFVDCKLVNHINQPMC